MSAHTDGLTKSPQRNYPDNIALGSFLGLRNPAWRLIVEQEIHPLLSPTTDNLHAPPAPLHHNAFVTTDQEAIPEVL